LLNIISFRRRTGTFDGGKFLYSGVLFLSTKMILVFLSNTTDQFNGDKLKYSM
jgi:hypothetical protein